MKTTVIGYARVSTDGQSERQTIQQQVQAIEAYCDEKDFYLIEIYKDDGVSGTSLASDRVWKLLGFLDEWENCVDQLVVTAYDRLVREAEIQFLFEKELKKRKIELVVVQQQGLENDDPNNKLVRHLMGILSEWERDQIVSRVKRGMNNRIKNRHLPTKPPYGYRCADKGIVTVREEMNVIKLIYDLAVGRRKFWPGLFTIRAHRQKKYLHLKIARQLQSMGIHHINERDGKPLWWEPRDIIRIILNPFYCGVMTYYGEYMLGAHEKAVDVTDWVKAAKAITKMPRPRNGGRGEWTFPNFTSPKYADLFSSLTKPSASSRKSFPVVGERL